MRRAAIVLLFASCAAQACQIPAAKVSHQKGTYSVAVEMHLDAPPDAVYPVITDYENMKRLSETFQEATVVKAEDDSHLRRQLHIKTCVLFFCFDMVMVEDIEEDPNGIITTTIIPEESDFHEGQSRWELTANDDGTSILHFSSERRPKFWVPPVIGPWILKRKVLKETIATCHRIQALAVAPSEEF